MQTAEKIRRFGFRRWFERALLESHAYLVTCFLGVIAMIAGLELIADRHNLGCTMLGVFSTGIGTALTLFGLRRYLDMLVHALDLSERATCPACNTYAAFAVTNSNRDDAEAGDAGIEV